MLRKVEEQGSLNILRSMNEDPALGVGKSINAAPGWRILPDRNRRKRIPAVACEWHGLGQIPNCLHVDF